MGQADDPDLFATTRGKVLLLLCQGPKTVNELMDALGVTDNAVRAQLANLQDDGLVRQVGLRPGTRKPHVDYELTPKARQLFPHAYEPVLRVLLDVLRDGVPPDALQAVMQEVARRLLTPLAGDLRAPTPEARAAELCRRLEAFATGLRVEQADDDVQVRACGCPLASLTATHPEICQVIAGVLAELIGTPVTESCNRSDTPRCCFSIPRPDAR